MSGHMGIILPSLDQLHHRLTAITPKLQGTDFRFERRRAPAASFDYLSCVLPKIHLEQEKLVEWIDVQCPWGNHFRIYERDTSDLFDAYGVPRFPDIGLAYIEELCKPGTAGKIASYYERFFGTNVSVLPGRSHVQMGPHQELIFREVDIPPIWSGTHVCIYVNRFAKVWREFKKRDMLYKKNRFSDRYDTWEEAVEHHQFRVADIFVESETGYEVVHQLEHEVRSLNHPYYHRALVNRLGNLGIRV